MVKHQDGEESQAEYDELHAAIVEHFQPVGWREEDLVDKIAAWSWRLRRVMRYERGQIARALAQHIYELQQSKAASAEEPGSIPTSSSESGCIDGSSFFDD